MRARGDARRGRRTLADGAARARGADGMRLRRLLRLCGRDPRTPCPARRRRPGAPSGMMLLNASGCLDALTAPEIARSFDAYVTKTVTPLPREGSRPVRIADADVGLLNSIGLSNPGIDRFVSDTLP